MNHHLPHAHAIGWSSRIDQSVEICWVQRDGPRWTVNGAATMIEAGTPFAIDYRIDFHRETMETRFDARVRVDPSHERRVTITGDPDGFWNIVGGDPGGPERLTRCVCLDLGWTPLTNTFSIWKLDLAIGASAEITNAWVPFPAFTLEPCAQRYTRLSARRFLYEQAGIAFQAVLDVDDLGFVRQYGDIGEPLRINQDIAVLERHRR